MDTDRHMESLIALNNNRVRPRLATLGKALLMVGCAGIFLYVTEQMILDKSTRDIALAPIGRGERAANLKDRAAPILKARLPTTFDENAGHKSGGQPAWGDLHNRFLTALDYYELALELLEHARRGEPESQYYLAKVLWECRQFLDQSQSRGATQYNDPLKSQMPVHHLFGSASYELAVELHQRCQGFIGAPPNQFKDDAAWFWESANNDYPPARFLSEMALLRLNPDSINPERKGLLYEAFASGHPDIYFHLATEYSGYSNHFEQNPRSLAWLMIACDAGASDCRRNASWFVGLCGIEQSCSERQNLVEYYRSISAPSVREEAERLKLEINRSTEMGFYEKIELFQNP